MLAEATTVPSGTRLRSQVCVVGGGPSGIVLALTLARAGIDVLLLESGVLHERPESQDLNRATNVGLPYFELDESDYRVLGGASNRWGGWCRPLDPLDFERRAWVPHSGWPIDHEDLAGHYDRAAQWCELPETTYDPQDWPEAVPSLYRTPFVDGEVRTVVWQGSPPTKFGVVHRASLEREALARVLLDATVVELEADDDGGRVAAARVVAGDGRTFWVEADRFVLTAGAIQTARLLLASNTRRPDGLGNGHDLVGRFFQEHPHVPSGIVHVAPPGPRPSVRALDEGLAGAWSRFSLQRPSGGIKCAYGISEETTRRLELLNFSAHLVVGSTRERSESEAYRALRLVAGNLRNPAALLRQARTGAIPEGVGTQLRRIAAEPGEVARLLGGLLLERPTRLELYAQTEQSPNPDSRVLVDHRDPDASGLPRARLDWRMASQDLRSIRVAQDVLGEQFQRAGLGTVEHEPWLLEEEWSPLMHGGHHHLGTARMAASPRAGVVDADLRVHDVANLWIGDGSVLPTTGFANPLLTIVALALRLADHLAADR